MPTPRLVPAVLLALAAVALAFWMLEKAGDEALLSLESERRRRRELETELSRKREEMDGALDKINELRPEPDLDPHDGLGP